MPLLSGDQFGPYEILAPLGAGGMGEVYRAKDVRLDREVAIKVLPGAVAQDRERLARFEREAKVLASLNHPNIAQIYGLEDNGSARALAMELVPGTTLQVPQPLETALGYALQIAEALEAAHDKGVTHRDLKPANIMVTPEGTVKLLDFGLAAVPGADPSTGVDSANSPTLTVAATQAGMILGTAAYMSPEQAAGKTVDRRTDIWSFGVVLYEMLAGERLFHGETISHTLADVLRAEIPFDRLPPSTPAPIRDLLRRCLDRDIKTRLQWIGEARIAIQNYLKNPVAGISRPADQPKGLRWLWPAISGLLAIVLLAGAGLYFRRPAEGTRAVRLSFTPPAGLSFNDTRDDEFAVSPDGRTVAFTARNGEGRRLLWIRALDSAEAKPLPESTEALAPFWSPDSRSVAFGSQGKLRRVDLADGSTAEICDAPRLTGGTWNSEGIILFSPDYRTTLYRVPARGGTPVAASVLDSGKAELFHYNPRFLPDGKHFLFRTEKALAVGVLGSMQVKSLSNFAQDAQFVPPNWLLYVSNGALLAHHFDSNRQEFEGEPMTLFRVPEGSIETPGRGRLFTVSGNGVLLWRGLWQRDSQLVWRNRSGQRIGVEGPAEKISGDGYEPRLSPDGRRFVFRSQATVWVTDVGRYVPLRIDVGQVPLWSPDGREVAYLSEGLRRMQATGLGGSRKLADGVSAPCDWSPDGRFLVFQLRRETTRTDLFIIRMEGDGQARVLIDSPGDDRGARFSPDGAWIAYASNEAGTSEVYVRSFTRDGQVGAARQRVSSNGGTSPVWNRNGRELFYISPQSDIMAVPVTRKGAELAFGTPVVLFRTILPGAGAILGGYDVAPDGQRFLLGELIGEPSNPIPTVVLNWPGLLSK